MTDTLIKVEKVSKKFCRSLKRSLWYGMQDLGSELLRCRPDGNGELREHEFWAVKDVSFELKRGECLGLIGLNGAGKTTLLRMLNGLIRPDQGRIEMRGRVGALIALGAGFNPVLTGRENIYVNAAVLGFSQREVDAKLNDIVDFSQLNEFIDSPVMRYSSGMYVRLGFSVAAHFNPDILLVDEALAVGDLAFAVKCLNRIAELRKGGTTVIFVSHNELQVREAAQSCILMHQGRAKFFEKPDQAFLAYDSLRMDLPVVEETDHGFVHDGPIRIEAIRFAGEAGSPRTGEDLKVMLRCRTDVDCFAADLEFRFWNAAGQLVSSIRSSVCGKVFQIPQGDSEIAIHFQSLPLAPGHYRIAGGFRRNGEVLGWSRDLAHIDVLPPIWSYYGGGQVFLQVRLDEPVSVAHVIDE